MHQLEGTLARHAEACPEPRESRAPHASPRPPLCQSVVQADAQSLTLWPQITRLRGGRARGGGGGCGAGRGQPGPEAHPEEAAHGERLCPAERSGKARKLQPHKKFTLLPFITNGLRGTHPLLARRRSPCHCCHSHIRPGQAPRTQDQETFRGFLPQKQDVGVPTGSFSLASRM